MKHVIKNEIKSVAYVPRVTSNAGFALTEADWQALGIHTLAASFESLLVKPGFEVLKQLTSLASYLGGRDVTLVLNGASLKRNSKGLYQVRSVFDGNNSSYSLDALVALVSSLKPHMFIVPDVIFTEISLVLPESIDLMIPWHEYANHAVHARVKGVYVSFEGDKPDLSSFLTWKLKHPHVPCYVAGCIDKALFSCLLEAGIEWVETDKPAEDGLSGVVYTEKGPIQITSLEWSLDFSRIDDTCTCPTCNAGFTKAYLHHLYLNTQGLCQRLLIQHNIPKILQNTIF